MQQTNWKRNTAVFLSSQAISLFGSSLVQFAITWYVTSTTQSGIYTTISIICSFLPTLFLSPFAGVWADRYDRKKLIMYADGAIAASTLVLAILFLSGFESIWLLFVVSAIRALGGAVQSPAINAMLPDMVPEENLSRVNGIYGSVQSLISLGSPALAGVLFFSVGSLELIMFIDVITAALAIFILLRFLKLPERKAQPQQQTGYFNEIKEGAQYIYKHKYLLYMFLYCVAVYFCLAPVSFLTPLQVVRSYGESDWMLPAIEMAFSLGMLAGGVLISVWGGLKNRVYSMGFAMLGFSAFTIVLGINIPFWGYLLVMGILGVTLPMFNTPAVTLLQEKVDPNYIGRVFSVLNMISSSVVPLGMLVWGPLADALPIEWLLVITGSITLVSTLVMLTNRTVIRAGKQKAAVAGE